MSEITANIFLHIGNISHTKIQCMNRSVTGVGVRWAFAPSAKREGVPQQPPPLCLSSTTTISGSTSACKVKHKSLQCIISYDLFAHPLRKVSPDPFSWGIKTVCCLRRTDFIANFQLTVMYFGSTGSEFVICCKFSFLISLFSIRDAVRAWAGEETQAAVWGAGFGAIFHRLSYCASPLC